MIQRLSILLFVAASFLMSPQAQAAQVDADWLIHPEAYRAKLSEDSALKTLTLANGLVSRTWKLAPNVACVSLRDLVSDAELLRAVNPEAIVTIDGQPEAIGGLVGQPNRAFLTAEWIDHLRADPAAWQYQGHTIAELKARMEWPRVRHHAPDAVWPPQGEHLIMRFTPPLERTDLLGVQAWVHYELYDGIPLISKWVEVTNESREAIEIDHVQSEVLSVVESTNWVESREGAAQPIPDHLHVETDYAFGGFNRETAMAQTVHWRTEPEYTSQVNYRLQTPCRLVVEPQWGPDVIVTPGQNFKSVRAFELVLDSTDRERRGLARRRMMRTLAPWVTENPLTLHVVSTAGDVVRTAIDQAAECGFEMVSLSFGSGLNMEDASKANHAKFRELAQYAQSKGIELGGYSLLASRRIQPDTDNCIHPETGQPGGQTFGYAPALASDWGRRYFKNLRAFFEETGFMQFTHDGSYPGDVDAAERMPWQRGLDDSQWVQWNMIADFYRWLRSRGVYLRVPDYYYFVGSNECGMGYREVNWSLPRAQQVIHTRQNIFDGTWTKTPSMGWMFVPLTQYHGGGAAATIEPLSEHLDHYERMLQSNLALGVQAVYRGTRLYDTDETKAVVQRWVDWYKQYRDILESDLIHGRRADGRDLDWMLHVNPNLTTPGMLIVFNPTRAPLKRTLHVPLRYTGLTGEVRVHAGQGAPRTLRIHSNGALPLPVHVPAQGMAWYAIRKP